MFLIKKTFEQKFSTLYSGDLCILPNWISGIKDTLLSIEPLVSSDI